MRCQLVKFTLRDGRDSLHDDDVVAAGRQRGPQTELGAGGSHRGGMRPRMPTNSNAVVSAFISDT
jgi:hypothetical protein